MQVSYKISANRLLLDTYETNKQLIEVFSCFQAQEKRVSWRYSLF